MTAGDPVADGRQAGASGEGGGGAPPPPDVDPLYFRREPMVEDTWLDPETGEEHAGSGARFAGVLGLVFIVLGVFATWMLLAGEWHVPVFDAELHALVKYLSESQQHGPNRIPW